MWEPYKKGFRAYLQLERSLADNSVSAYLSDMEKLTQFLLINDIKKSPSEIDLSDLQGFIKWIAELGMTQTSQARLISALRSFYKYCLLEDITPVDPTTLLEAPKLKRSLPDVLSFEEIENILAEIDLSTAEGTRNKAILETMYSCGLRVSEVVNLKLSQLFLDVGFVRVIGKGNKERLVPIGSSAIKYILIYENTIRNHQIIQTGEEDILFFEPQGKTVDKSDDLPDH